MNEAGAVEVFDGDAFAEVEEDAAVVDALEVLARVSELTDDAFGSAFEQPAAPTATVNPAQTRRTRERRDLGDHRR
ncbi:hypothetical protein ACSMXN_15755 [Jatrophihabitans sp. DSM 45814]